MTNSDLSQGPVRGCFHHPKVGNLSPLFFTGEEFVQIVARFFKALSLSIQANERTTSKF